MFENESQYSLLQSNIILTNDQWKSICSKLNETVFNLSVLRKEQLQPQQKYLIYRMTCKQSQINDSISYYMTLRLKNHMFFLNSRLTNVLIELIFNYTGVNLKDKETNSIDMPDANIFMAFDTYSENYLQFYKTKTPELKFYFRDNIDIDNDCFNYESTLVSSSNDEPSNIINVETGTKLNFFENNQKNKIIPLTPTALMSMKRKNVTNDERNQYITYIPATISSSTPTNKNYTISKVIRTEKS